MGNDHRNPSEHYPEDELKHHWFIITRNIMTHQQNKHFNTYKEGLDLEFLREYCMEHGERRSFLRGETLEEAGEPAQWVAFVERGCFKYMVHNDEEGKDYCTGFAFEGEFVTDSPTFYHSVKSCTL